MANKRAAAKRTKGPGVTRAARGPPTSRRRSQPARQRARSTCRAYPPGARLLHLTFGPIRYPMRVRARASLPHVGTAAKIISEGGSYECHRYGWKSNGDSLRRASASANAARRSSSALVHRRGRSDQLRRRRRCTSSQEACSFSPIRREKFDCAAALVLIAPLCIRTPLRI